MDNQPLPDTLIQEAVARRKTTQTQEDTLVRETVRDVLALRKLTKDCGTKTSRTQGEILQSLEPKILTRVARILAETEEAPQ